MLDLKAGRSPSMLATECGLTEQRSNVSLQELLGIVVRQKNGDCANRGVTLCQDLENGHMIVAFA